jgi:outer membrane lipoprotein-sorting protein
MGHRPIRLVARGVIGGQQVVRTGKPQANNQTVREAFLTVLDKPPFTLEPITLSARVEQNQSASVEVVVRRNGFTGDIQVTAEGFSSGKEPLSRNVDVQAVTLKGADSRATLNLRAKLDSETGTRFIVFKAEAKVDGQTVTQYSRAILLSIDPFPFTLANSLPRLAIAALPPEKKSAASEAEFSVKTARRGWFTDDISLSVEGVPEGITITTTNLARGVNEAGFKIIASDKASVGKEVSLTVVGTANVNGRAYQLRAPAVVLTVNAPAEAAEGAPEKSATASPASK